MSAVVLSSQQREILDALADHWELLRWRCNDGSHRWHLGDMEVDGRAVRGLLQRGLLVHGGDFIGGQLLLMDAGRVALGGATNARSGAPGASVDDQQASPAPAVAGEKR